MPIVMTESGPKPTLSLRNGSLTDLARPSVPLRLWGTSELALTGGGNKSFEAIYRTQPWVATVVRRLTEQKARLPLKTYRYLDAAEETRERVKDHPVARLLTQPRPRTRGFHLRWDIALSLNVHGNAAVWKRRPSRGAPPAELWPLDWRLAVPWVDDTGTIAFWEWHGADVPGLATGARIPVDDVIHVAWRAPTGQLGVSPLEQLGVTIGHEDAAQRYAAAAFRNGTRFGVGVILDEKVTADQVVRDGLRDEIVGAHGGVDQSFRPAILGGGVKDVKPLGAQTAEEAALVEQRKVNRDEILAVYGIPPPLAGVLEHATLANVAEYSKILYRTVLGPPLKLIEETIQAQLVDSEPAWAADGVFLEHDLGEVLKGDVEARMQAYAVALTKGILVLNDVRRLENLPPYENPLADEPLIEANNVRPLSMVGQDPPPAAPAAPAAAGNGNGNGGSPSQEAMSFVRAALTDPRQ